MHASCALIRECCLGYGDVIQVVYTIAICTQSGVAQRNTLLSLGKNNGMAELPIHALYNTPRAPPILKKKHPKARAYTATKRAPSLSQHTPLASRTVGAHFSGPTRLPSIANLPLLRTHTRTHARATVRLDDHAESWWITYHDLLPLVLSLPWARSERRGQI